MNNSMKFLVEDSNNNERLDIFLSKKISYLTRSYLKKIIEKKYVKINNEIVIFPSKKIKKDDSVLIVLASEKSKKLLPSKIKLDICFIVFLFKLSSAQSPKKFSLNPALAIIVCVPFNITPLELSSFLAFRQENNLSV